MTWWRKASPSDAANSAASANPWVIDGWLKIQSIWRKASPSDAANSAASANPWVIDGWLKIKSAWRHEGGGIWTRIFGSTSLPTATYPYPELYFIWPDTFLTIDAPINGSKMFATRGAWTEEPLQFRIRIQEKAPGGTWTAIYDTDKTYSEYLDSDASDRFPSNANDSSRPTISKTRTRDGYQFRAKVDVTSPTGITNFYDTEAMMPRMDFYISTFYLYDETSTGATFAWGFGATSTNTVNDTLDIYSQTLRVYDDSNNLVVTQTVPAGTTTYTLSNSSIEANQTYSVELEVVGKDGYATTADPTTSYEYVDLITVIDKPEIITSPTFTLQSGTANKRNSVYRLTSGTWTNNPTGYRYIIELNNAAGTVIAYYPSSTTWTTDLYYDHTFLNLTTSSVSGSVIAYNGESSLPAYASNSVGPITELQYTVTYDEQGGTAVSDATVNAGSSTTLPSTSRNGYNFDGWYTAITGGTFLGYAGTSYTPPSNITIYARWSQITYTVTWNANGGSVSPTSSSGVLGATVTAPTPTRAEYDFVYWRNPATGDMLYNINAGSTWTINGSITFTAVWTPKQYTITYNEQGGTNVNDVTVNSGAVIQLPSTSRSGYTFDGWYTAATGGTFLGYAGTNYTVSASTTIYARWSVITYTVTWNANGGSVSPTSSTGALGDTVIAPTPTRSGYDFVYWRNPATGDMLYNINAGSVWTINGSITFTAVWQVAQYTVTYNEQGGTNVNDVTVNAGSVIQLPSTSRSGYDFNGWYTASSGGTYLGISGSNYTVNSSVTIYAQWSAITYTVTWNANGGSVSPTSSSGVMGATVTAPTPTRSGYTFNYWRHPNTGDFLYSVNGGSNWTINGTLTFYAVWTQAISNATAPTTVTATGGNGSATVSWSGATNATKYRIWWSTSASGNGVNPASSYDAETTSTSVTFSNLSNGTTYYFWVSASNTNDVWTSYSSSPRGSATPSAPVTQYTVTWNANGGSVSPSSNTVNSGSSVTAPTPTRSGYTFSGWYNSSSGGSYIVGAGGSYTVTANVTLYAQWTSSSCTCTYSDQGSYYYSPGCCTPTTLSGLPTVYNSGNSVCTNCYVLSDAGSCCNNINKRYTKCSANDVSSTSSPVYFYCYSTGQCINSTQGAGGSC